MLRKRCSTRPDGTYCACAAGAITRRATAKSSSPDSPAMVATAACVAVPAWQIQSAYSPTERGCTTLARLQRLRRLLHYTGQLIFASLILHDTEDVSFELLNSRQKVYDCVSSAILAGCDEYLPQVQLVADSSMRL